METLCARGIILVRVTAAGFWRAGMTTIKDIAELAGVHTPRLAARFFIFHYFTANVIPQELTIVESYILFKESADFGDTP